MTTLTVIVEDSLIVLGGQPLHVNYDFPSNLWAIQWDGTEGEIEWTDGPNTEATLSFVQPYIDSWNSTSDANHEERKQQEMSGDPVEYMRAKRTHKLKETDEWALSDRTMTTAQTTYRQALRDLPDHATDWNPTITWDDSDADRDNHTSVFSGVTWPTKP